MIFSGFLVFLSLLFTSEGAGRDVLFPDGAWGGTFPWGGIFPEGGFGRTKCRRALAMAGASQYFAAHVGHAIHYITVEDLQRFEPSVTVDNIIPTVNKKLNSSYHVLEYAPKRDTDPSPSPFKTQAMQVADEVLSHLGEDWDAVDYGPVERLVHGLHMVEVWEGVLQVYNKLNAINSNVLERACECARDTKRNGIKKFLKLLALAIRDKSAAKRRGVFLEGSEQDTTPYTDHELINTPLKTLFMEMSGSGNYRKLGIWLSWRASKEAWQRLKLDASLVAHDKKRHEDVALYLRCALQKRGPPSILYLGYGEN